MDQYLNDASTLATQLFGPDSGIPWWAWALVVVAIAWKILIPERMTAADRDAALIAMATGAGEGGKKKKKSKKK